MKAGTYYIGDLCYVLTREEWDELGDLSGWEDGIFTMKSGRVVEYYGTAYGDGSYEDQYGNEYLVDSGTIGITSFEGLADVSGGHMHKFDGDFEVHCGGGHFDFGGIIIDTNDEGDEW